MTCHPMAACVREPNPPAGFPSHSHKEHRLAVLGRGVQPAVHDIVEQSGQAGLAWERLGAAVDQVDDIGIDIEAGLAAWVRFREFITNPAGTR
jgi:hypothetical protein